MRCGGVQFFFVSFCEDGRLTGWAYTLPVGWGRGGPRRFQVGRDRVGGQRQRDRDDVVLPEGNEGPKRGKRIDLGDFFCEYCQLALGFIL